MMVMVILHTINALVVSAPSSARFQDFILARIRGTTNSPKSAAHTTVAKIYPISAMARLRNLILRRDHHLPDGIKRDRANHAQNRAAVYFGQVFSRFLTVLSLFLRE
jgi:hypothetical protein